MLLQLVVEMNTLIHEEGPEAQSFFAVSGYVSYIRADDRTFYNACKECKRKVTQDQSGWKCENCDKYFEECVPTYMLLAKVSDLSDSCYVNFYREAGNTIMGISAEEYKNLKENEGEGAAKEHATSRLYKPYLFLLKAKQESFADEMRIKIQAQKVVEHSYAKENKFLLQRLEMYENKPNLADEEAMESY